MAEKMAEQIAEILKEPNFQTAEKALTDFYGPMDGEFRDLLMDIIVERWIDTPKDVPFSYARSIWNRKDINREEYQALLEEIRSYPIAPINKAKISDFLWVVGNDFSNAKIAETAYCEHLKKAKWNVFENGSIREELGIIMPILHENGMITIIMTLC